MADAKDKLHYFLQWPHFNPVLLLKMYCRGRYDKISLWAIITKHDIRFISTRIELISLRKKIYKSIKI